MSSPIGVLSVFVVEPVGKLSARSRCTSWSFAGASAHIPATFRSEMPDDSVVNGPLPVAWSMLFTANGSIATRVKFSIGASIAPNMCICVCMSVGVTG